MKHLIPLLLMALLSISFGYAQNAPKLTIHPIGKDSINLVMNDRYNLVDDSCSTIIRYGHYNFNTHKFFGKFTDVSKDNPSLIRTEGAYTAEGAKDGEFIARFNNGNIQSKGSYQNNKYLGKWEIFYRNGKPEINFEADATGNIKITDVWNNKGVKTIDNGKGAYQFNMGSITWKGDLVDGYPDGMWTAVSRNSTAQNILISENYKKGKFQKGKSQGGDYTDASHMVIIEPSLTPYVYAEELITAPNGCTPPKRQRITVAKIPNGSGDFYQVINSLIAPYLAKTDYKKYEDDVTFEGVVSSEGIPGNFKCVTLFNNIIADGMIDRLKRLPTFEPATVNGRPVPQGINITFKFRAGVYSISYKMLPVKIDQ